MESRQGSRIAARYTATNLSGKEVCKRDLLETFRVIHLNGWNAPVVGMISRLVDQKGFDLIESAIHRMLALDLGLVVLGTGEAVTKSSCATSPSAMQGRSV